MCGPLDLAACHEHFSAACFNATWALIDNPERTDDDNLDLLSVAFASRYHWRQRSDCTAKHLSVSSWLLSRVYAELGDSVSSLQWAERSLDGLDATTDVFYVAYGHEARARAHALGGRLDAAAADVGIARDLAGRIENESHRDQLLDDLLDIPVAAAGA